MNNPVFLVYNPSICVHFKKKTKV